MAILQAKLPEHGDSVKLVSSPYCSACCFAQQRRAAAVLPAGVLERCCSVYDVRHQTGSQCSLEIDAWERMACECRYGYKGAVGFVPTGWTFQMKAESFPVHEKPPWKIHLIPYSEHSSFSDLQEFVKFLRPKHIIPTVGMSGGEADRSAHKMLSHFRHLCDQSGAKRAFLGPLIAAAGSLEAHQVRTAACDKPSGLDSFHALRSGKSEGDLAREPDAAQQGACEQETGAEGHGPAATAPRSASSSQAGCSRIQGSGHDCKQQVPAAGEASTHCEVPLSSFFIACRQLRTLFA